MYDYDYERKKRKVEPKFELSQKDTLIEYALLFMTAAALVFFFFKVMFF